MQVRAIWTAFSDSTLKHKGTGTKLDPQKILIGPKLKIKPARKFQDLKKNPRVPVYRG